MSTQRRASHWQHGSCMERAGVLRHICLSPVARYDHVRAKIGTAPPEKLVRYRPNDQKPSSGAPEWLATNSLLSDYRTKQLVRFVRIVQQDIRSSSVSSPPLRAGDRANFGTPATQRSSLSHLPFPSGFARLHPTSPQFPAGSRRRAERYDGKGNLHFQHAA